MGRKQVFTIKGEGVSFVDPCPLKAHLVGVSLSSTLHNTTVWKHEINKLSAARTRPQSHS